MPPSTFIVAEVSKNWIAGSSPSGPRLICQLFEAVLETNRQRGYELHSFTLHRLLTGPDELNETIIAVFRRQNEEVRP